MYVLLYVFHNCLMYPLKLVYLLFQVSLLCLMKMAMVILISQNLSLELRHVVVELKRSTLNVSFFYIVLASTCVKCVARLYEPVYVSLQAFYSKV